VSLFERRLRGGEARMNEHQLTAERMWAARRRGTSSGRAVTDSSATEVDPVWAAVTLIQSLGSTVPLSEIEKRGDERIRVPLSPIFSDPDPDPSIDDVGFRAQCLWSAATWGNTYVELLGRSVRNGGRPEAMTTIDPARAEWRRDKDTNAWALHIDGERRERWPLGNVWHFPLNLKPGRPFGLNPIHEMRETIGVALAAREWSASYFGQGPLPLYLFHNESTKDPGKTGADRLKARIMEAFDGSRDPVLLPRGIKGEQIKIAANESQFLETQRLSVEQVARVFFGGFPQMIGGAASGSSVTYANLEQEVSAFTGLSLMPRYLIPFERALSRLAAPEREVKHKIDAIVRADLAARFDAYVKNAQVYRLTGQPVYTSDEVRDLEDRRRLDPDLYPLIQPSAAGRAPSTNA
jgi:HK97 family phage portal protein